MSCLTLNWDRDLIPQLVFQCIKWRFSILRSNLDPIILFTISCSGWWEGSPVWPAPRIQATARACWIRRRVPSPACPQCSSAMIVFNSFLGHLWDSGTSGQSGLISILFRSIIVLFTSNQQTSTLVAFLTNPWPSLKCFGCWYFAEGPPDLSIFVLWTASWLKCGYSIAESWVSRVFNSVGPEGVGLLLNE